MTRPPDPQSDRGLWRAGRACGLCLPDTLTFIDNATLAALVENAGNAIAKQSHRIGLREQHGKLKLWLRGFVRGWVENLQRYGRSEKDIKICRRELKQQLRARFPYLWR